MKQIFSFFWNQGTGGTAVGATGEDKVGDNKIVSKMIEMA